MRLLILSDIHGCISTLEKALYWYGHYHCSHLILLGDLLNHGPRNPVPEGYNPAGVAECLNDYAQRIIAVRGNCDSEVDQMLLRFPMMDDGNWLIYQERRIFLTHGHRFSPETRPPLSPGDGVIYGHTHLPRACWQEDIVFINPGSITFPKENKSASFATYDGRKFAVRELVSGQEMTSVLWPNP